MIQNWAKSWNRSVQPKKQRKYIRNAPLHIKQKLLAAHLSKELRVKHKRRSVTIRVGDKVKVLRGQFKKKTGKVTKLNLNKRKAYLEGIELVKRDGTKVQYPINPSNLLITELFLEDKRRKKTLERKK